MVRGLTSGLPWACSLAMALALSFACGGGDSSDDPTPTRESATSTRPASTATRSAEASTTATVAAVATEPVANTPAPAPTLPPAPPTQPPPPSPTEPPGAVSLTIVATGTRFVPTSLAAPTGSAVTVTLDNQDAALLHDFTIFDPGGTKLASTQPFEGPAAVSVTFNVPAPGNYPFICTVHPQQMRGTLVVQ